MEIRKCFYFISLLVIFAASSQAQDDFINKRITMKTENVRFSKIIGILIEEYDIAIGFEQAANTSPDVALDFDFQENRRDSVTVEDGDVWPEWNYPYRKYGFSIDVANAPLKEILDKIVAQMPDYKWAVNDGVVNIFPAKNRDIMLENLLSVKISSFFVKSPAYVLVVQSEVSKMPEIKEFDKTNNTCSAFISPRNDIITRRALNQDIRFSNMPFLQLLNEVTKIKRGGWILRTYQYTSGAKCIFVQL